MSMPPLADVSDRISGLPAPLLILSSHAGRGMYSIGEAVRQDYTGAPAAVHLPIEALLPEEAVAHDLHRYRTMVFRAPWLLHLMYRVPWLYRRKLLREQRSTVTSLDALRSVVLTQGIRSVLAISHRAAFWAGALKHRESIPFQLWGLEAEFGPSLAWRYVFWQHMDGLLSPQRRSDVPYPLRSTTEFCQVRIPVSRVYTALASQPGDRNHVLLTGGYWGLGALLGVAHQLKAACPGLHIDVICGDNRDLYDRVVAEFGSDPSVRVYGVVESMVSCLARAGAVIGKPGISTIVEVTGAGRKLFLLRGLPVAEEHNAHHAIAHLGASWFSVAAFQRWRQEGR